MQPTRTKAIGGIGTALLVLGVIGLVGCALSAVGLVIGSGVSLFAEPIRILGGQVSISGVLMDAVKGTAGFIGGVLSIITGALAAVLCAGVGDIARKNAGDLAEYDHLFKCAVGAAIVTLLFGGALDTVLLVILAVFVHKDRKEAAL